MSSTSIGFKTTTLDTLTLDQLMKQKEADKVGKGSNAGSAYVPPAQGTPLGREEADFLSSSLSVFMSSGAMAGDVEVLLVQVAVTMRDTEATSQKSKINTDQETKKAQAEEKLKKLEEAQKKLEEAEEKKNGGSILDKIKLAFEWIGALLAVVAAVALIATGAGAFVGAMLIGAAATSLVMATDSTVQMATGKGIAGNIAKLAGASDEEAQKADMGFRISMAVIGIAFAIAGGGASAVNALKSGASAGVEASNQTMKMVQTGMNIANGVNTAGAASIDAGRAGLAYSEKSVRADAKDLEAEAKRQEASMQMLDAAIDQALSTLIGAGDRFNAILDNIMEGIKDRMQVQSKVRFGS